MTNLCLIYRNIIEQLLGNPDCLSSKQSLIPSILNEMLLQCACLDNEVSMAWYMRERLSEYTATIHQNLKTLIKYYPLQDECTCCIEWCERFIILLKEGQIVYTKEHYQQFMQHMQSLANIRHITLTDHQLLASRLELYDVFIQIITQQYPQYLSINYSLGVAITQRQNFLEILITTLADQDQLWRLLVFLIAYHHSRQKIIFQIEQLQYLQLSEIMPPFKGCLVQVEKEKAALFSFLPSNWGQDGVIALGDLHGDASSLRKNPRTAFLSLGDFIDRGPHSFETCIALFVLQSIYPEKFALVCGNHEHAAYQQIDLLDELPDIIEQ